ncbi:hypothetical protein PUATCC27989T_05323 [Phytobacter ursingii]|uniref:Lipoprotein n=1 Tax=Phytobacter ursingii TaxID=1972431 RepID=A0AB35RLW9_9ENTR|nr:MULTISPECIES: putative T6SS immunity periplasmic lipoprotein [Enterobacteriaceae]MDV2862454.1 hypothetical protein [Phytobacter ursingii]GJL37525.1 hypothetical protein TUM17576_43450 [Enterobacter hormaechei]VTP17323.1 hypothetical protein PUATCC27989T_05323 [Phytobacter ursingii]
MRKLLVFLPLTFVLTGCPGGNPAPHPRSTFIDGNNLCFSVDRNDVLNYYTIESSKGKGYAIIAAKEKLKLSYPGSCINIKWDYGYSYAINYGLNGQKYIHEFFIDNNGRLTNLGGL